MFCGRDVVRTTATRQAAGRNSSPLLPRHDSVEVEGRGSDVARILPSPDRYWNACLDVDGFGAGERHRGTRAGSACGIVGLGTLPGGSQSVAVAINDAGTIVGAADSPTGWHAVRWDRTGRITDLGALPGAVSTSAKLINDAGTSAGISVAPDGPHLLRWDERGRMTDLGVIPGTSAAEIKAINAEGTILGEAVPGDGQVIANV
jgi:probable HAF family extracellular repeat protein